MKSCSDRVKLGSAARLPYQAPKLVLYGSMKLFTTGGTGNRSENVNQGQGTAKPGANYP
jgi:hypothetical protein